MEIWYISSLCWQKVLSKDCGESNEICIKKKYLWEEVKNKNKLQIPSSICPIWNNGFCSLTQNLQSSVRDLKFKSANGLCSKAMIWIPPLNGLKETKLSLWSVLLKVLTRTPSRCCSRFLNGPGQKLSKSNSAKKSGPKFLYRVKWRTDL